VQDVEKALLEHLRTGEADAVFVTRYMASFAREPYTACVVGELPLRLGIARDHPVIQERGLTQGLRSIPYLACWAGEEKESEVIGRVSREMISLQAAPSQIHILPNPETVFLQVMLGNGFSCSPDTHLYGYGIETVTLDRTVSMCLVWLNRNRNPSIQALKRWLSEGGESE
jgi:DNA-binding transcriptional LysR family regulator